MEHNLSFLPKDSPESNYAELRQLMLDKVQQLSGHVWSDYNLHDPGVTILEQLCYALTDIDYRASHSVEDLLAGKDDQVNLHRHGLFTPEEGLPCRPTTLVDYQKYVVDRFPELSYVIFAPAQNSQSEYSALQSQYNVYVKPTKPGPGCSNGSIECGLDESQRTLRAEMIKCFNEVRNLTEDINDVIFISSEACDLNAVIDVDGTRSEIEVLSEIYFTVEKILCGYIDRKSYRNTPNNKGSLSLDEMMTGPITGSGFIADSEFASLETPISLSGIVTAIKAVKGVSRIKSLHLVDAQGGIISNTLPSLIDKCYELTIPVLADDFNVQLYQQGKNLEITAVEFTEAYDMRAHNEFQYRQSFALKNSSPLRERKRKAIAAYVSVQTQFPNTYGINLFGVPPGYSKERKAQALQLKGYLMLFDQLMSDHVATVDNLKHFFSLRLDEKGSYKTQALNKKSIKDVDKLYKKIPDSDFLADDINYEDYSDRKDRALDYILAINGRDKEQYGVEFTNPYFNRDEVKQELLRNKRKSLSQVHELSANRGGAFDYSEPSWGRRNVSSLEKYCANILGIDSRCRSLVFPLLKCGVQYREETEISAGLYFSKTLGVNTSDEAVDQSQVPACVYKNIQAADIRPRINSLARVAFLYTDDTTHDAYFKILENCLRGENCGWLDSVLSSCADLDLYRIGHIDDSSSFDLLVNTAADTVKGNEWQYIASFYSVRDAQMAANGIRRSVVKLNLEMEGMHLVERHLLLPVLPENDEENQIDASFYPAQVSVVLPDWTARFKHQEFRKYVETLLRRECAAHVYVHIHWLNYAEMKTFELVFKSWLQEKECCANLDSASQQENSNGAAEINSLNKLSHGLASFLHRLELSVNS